MKHIALASLLSFVLLGCATYNPVPDNYTGPVATIADDIFSESGSQARMFAVVEVDGNVIANSFSESARASSGQGFRLSSRFVERAVPVKPVKLKLRASHATAAPIQAIFGQLAGDFYSVEGVVDFTAKPNGKYVVKGELKKEGSSVWIEDSDTGQPATKRVLSK
jgi:hypothetical protein